MSMSVGKNIADLITVIHLNGLDHVNITDADVRTGKISIDSNGNKIVGNATQRYLEQNTSDATALATDINKGKTLYVNGKLITGTYENLTPTLAIKGTDAIYTVSSANTVAAGDFVKLSGSTVQKVSEKSDKILGIAMTSGGAGSNITVRKPNM